MVHYSYLTYPWYTTRTAVYINPKNKNETDERRKRSGVENETGRKKEKVREKRKTKQTCDQGAGRVPSTRFLIDGTISPMTCPADGPTEGRHRE